MNVIVVGIDFGTTNSCLSYYDTQLKKVVVIQNEHGHFTTPSILFLNPDSSEVLHGHSAHQLLESNHNHMYLSNIFNNIKRLIGKKLDNELIHFFKHNNVYEQNDKVYFKTKFDNKEQQLNVETLVIMYLKYLKLLVCNHFNLSETVIDIDIVITVPAYFNDYQRSMIKECCEMVRFNVLRIINEPTAASLAYALDKFKMGSDDEFILTFDCGGGTTDISLLHLDYADSIYEVKNTVGDNFLGGEDITLNLMNYIIKKLKLEDYDSPKYLNKIKAQAEKIKKILSFNTTATLLLEFGDTDYTLQITQTQFNEINKELFRKIENLIYYVLDNYIQQTRDFNYSNINSIVFVGGTTRIPYFKQLFQHIFPKAKINNTIDPDQTISIGASIQGALLNDLITEEDGGNTLLMDILPLSIGIETVGGIMTPVISRNSLLPISRTQKFTNSSAFENTIVIDIYQGERKLVRDNFHLASFQLESNEFEKYDTGEITITLSLEIDTNSIINATAIAKLRELEPEGEHQGERIVKSNIQVTKDKDSSSLLDTKLDEILYYSEINKLVDSELSNKILAKLELYNSFKYLLSTYHEKCQEKCDNSFLTLELNELYNQTFNVIQTFQDYSSQQLINIKNLFEKKWHLLIFNQEPIFKSNEGLIMETGGTTLNENESESE